MELSGVFWKNMDALKTGKRYISNRGGTRSGKTYSLLQLLYVLIEQKDGAGDVTSVVSETMPHLKRGAIRDFESIIGHPLRNDDCWNATDCVYTFQSGARLEFFSVDTSAKVLGPKRKRLFCNECNHISFDTFRQLDVRTTGKVFLDYNPAGLFWLIEKIEPKDDCVTINSTYKDNPFLSAEQVKAIESNADDKGWWDVYGLGLIGKLEGLIFPDFEQADAMPEKSDGMIESYGWDFGFTNDPSVLIHTLIDTRKKIIYADELCYRKGMLNADMAAVMKEQKVSRTAAVYGDAAEPKTIEELHRYGYNVQPCYKATKKAEQLQAMRGYRLVVTKRSLNLIRELRGYVWAQDKDGRLLNEPIAVNDHAMDAMRYSVFQHLRQPSAQTTRISRVAM